MSAKTTPQSDQRVAPYTREELERHYADVLDGVEEDGMYANIVELDRSEFERLLATARAGISSQDDGFEKVVHESDIYGSGVEAGRDALYRSVVKALHLEPSGDCEDALCSIVCAVGATAVTPRQMAERIVQRLADSEPDADTIDAQDLLKGTPSESMFCVSGAALEKAAEIALDDMLFDGERIAAETSTEPSERAHESKENDNGR